MLVAGRCCSFVYSPSRTTANGSRTPPVTALDVHSNADLQCSSTAIPWTLRGPKDVIDSIGGIQALLPLFETMPPASPRSPAPPNPADSDELFLIPSLIFLLSSFLRNHASNCVALYSLSGLSVIADSLSSHASTPPMKIVRYCRPAAKQLVDALMDLRSATATLPELEEEVRGDVGRARRWARQSRC